MLSQVGRYGYANGENGYQQTLSQGNQMIDLF